LQSLEDFKSLRVLGKGRTGTTVWEAVPKWRGGPLVSASVVVKACSTYHLTASALHRLLLEQRILQTVRHPHIIKGTGMGWCRPGD